MTMTNITINNMQAELEMSERKRLRLQRLKVLDGAESEDLNLWVMVDIMSLILVFFIILYATILPKTYPQISKYTGKQVLPLISDIAGEIDRNSQNNKRQRLKTQNQINEHNLIETKKSIHQAMSGTNISDYSIKVSKNKIVLVIGEKISFPEGKAQLLDNIKKPLQKIAQFLNKDNTHSIIISGHTDDTPINTAQFPSNWELSLARAMNVASFLMGNNVDPYNISVEGFGQYRPITDNDDREGRQMNRRVTISLINDPFSNP